MTNLELARAQREFLIRTEKRSALLLIGEFETLKKNIKDYLTTNLTGTITIAKLDENSFLDKVLDQIEIQITRIKNPFTRIVSRGQEKVINFASQSLRKFFEIKTSIFDPDQEAIAKLIGRTQSGTSLGQIFERMKPAVREIAKKTLVEGFSLGEPVSVIAARLDAVSGVGLRRALTLSRTEVNEAYRSASRSFYQEAEVKEYIWMSALDARTCITCWRLHGRKFKSSKKVFSHPNCRCTLVPKIKGQPKIPTGAGLFAKLQPVYQKQILGAQRFEMFEGGAKLDGFVGSEKTKEFGERFSIKNLSDFN